MKTTDEEEEKEEEEQKQDLTVAGGLFSGSRNMWIISGLAWYCVAWDTGGAASPWKVSRISTNSQAMGFAMRASPITKNMEYLPETEANSLAEAPTSMSNL